MRILYVINPKADINQWGRLGDIALAQYLIKELTSNHPEYKVDLVCGYPKGTEDFTPYIAKRVELGLNSIWHAFEYDPDKNLSQRKYWEYIKILPKYDIVHVHQAQVAASKYIHEYSKLTNTPVIWTLHNPPEGRATFSYAQDYQKIVDTPTCRLVCVSKSARDRLIKSMKLTNIENISVVYNGIPGDIYVHHVDKLYKYIGVGRIDPPKNTLGLLQFMKYMYYKYGHKSIYIGSTFSTYDSDSMYVSQCEDILNELAKAGGMVWIKEATHDEVLSYMSQASYYVNLSRVETFSLTSCEALSVGTPVICFDDAGPGEIVPEEYGVKIPVVYRRSFSSYIKDIEWEVKYNLDYKYNMTSMCEYVRDHFSVDIMAKNYINLYEEMIK